MENITYFKLMKEMDKIFPQTTDFDYQDVNLDELYDKIHNFLVSANINMPPYNLEVIRQNLRIYLRMSKSVRLDQNDAVIKTAVLSAKESTSSLILEAIREERPHFGQLNYREYGEDFGTVEEIRDYIDPKNIEEYVRKALTISYGNHNSGVGLAYIISDIAQHFGMHGIGIGVSIDEMNSAISKARTYVYEFNRENLEVPTHTIPSFNEEVFQSQLKSIIDKITNYITKNALEHLKKRIEFEEAKQRASQSPLEPIGNNTVSEPSLERVNENPVPDGNATSDDVNALFEGEDSITENERRKKEIEEAILNCFIKIQYGDGTEDLYETYKDLLDQHKKIMMTLSAKKGPVNTPNVGTHNMN